MVGKPCIGVLALQGGFHKHLEKLRELDVEAKTVRRSQELWSCDGLILPGGESTTISSLLDELRPHLRAFGAERPLMGTCAGMILMVKENLLSLAIRRNAYGRQTDSFSTSLTTHLPDGECSVQAIFIRAPQIQGILSNDVKVLATHKSIPVLVEQGKHLAMAFHPELSSDLTLHRYFLSKL